MVQKQKNEILNILVMDSEEILKQVQKVAKDAKLRLAVCRQARVPCTHVAVQAIEKINLLLNPMEQKGGEG